MRYILIALCIFSFVFGESLSARLDKLIGDKSIKKVTILKYNPFFTKKQEKQIKKKEITTNKVNKIPKLKLITIFNKKAFINGEWLGKNDKIHGYKIKNILTDYVVLVKKNRKKILRFERIKEILKVRK
ncbi:MAG: hypothetical protein GXP61_10150 [Epsilonproteobacteria bacterium]|nr:hypothetical protein [Campylobacterota bacterium]